MRFLLFLSIIMLLSACSDDSVLPPVVNGWYQRGAASNFYVVRSDDTIYSISFAFGLDYRDLVAANHLSPPYRLTSGERLKMTHRPEYRRQEPMEKPIQYSHKKIILHAEAEHRDFYASESGWRRPASGRLLQKFTRSPEGRPGISIGGRLGEPIRAASNGIVVYSGDGVRGYGNLIIVKKNDQYLSAYAFNQRNLVNVGDHVHAGQVIARMGKNDAGRSLLYFEIRYNGVPVDPMSFL